MFWGVPHVYNVLAVCAHWASANSNQLRLFRFAMSALYMHLSNKNLNLTWLGAWSHYFRLVFSHTHEHPELGRFLSFFVAFHTMILKFMFLCVHLWPIYFLRILLLFSSCCAHYDGILLEVLVWRIKQTQSNNNKTKPHDLSYFKYISMCLYKLYCVCMNV